MKNNLFFYFIGISLIHFALYLHLPPSHKHYHFSKNRVLNDSISVKLSLENRLIVEKRVILKPILKKKVILKKRITKQKIKMIEKELELSKTEVLADRGQETILAFYLEELKRLILAHKFYPRMAKKLKQVGKVSVSFEIINENEIVNLRVHSKCPFDRLNKAAIRTIERIALIPKLPSKLNKTQLKVVVPILFEIF